MLKVISLTNYYLAVVRVAVRGEWAVSMPDAASSTSGVSSSLASVQGNQCSFNQILCVHIAVIEISDSNTKIDDSQTL